MKSQTTGLEPEAGRSSHLLALPSPFLPFLSHFPYWTSYPSLLANTQENKIHWLSRKAGVGDTSRICSPLALQAFIYTLDAGSYQRPRCCSQEITVAPDTETHVSCSGYKTPLYLETIINFPQKLWTFLKGLYIISPKPAPSRKNSTIIYLVFTTMLMLLP